MKSRDYPNKILLAWAESINGNPEIRDWLMQNGYRELGIFHYALRWKMDAREWLLKNGFPHLMALINGVESNEGALQWLKKNNFHTLEKMARAADGDDAEMRWLAKNDKIMALIAMKMKEVKDAIDDDRSDIHKLPVE